MIHFGTGGFRGIIADDFNKQNIQLVAQGLSDMANAHNWRRPVVIGFDNRFMSDYAARWMAEVLTENGLIVYLYTTSCPTPSVMSATRDLNNDIGIMITASHNPYYYNGIKVFQHEGRDADVEFTTELEGYINNVKEIKSGNLYTARLRGACVDYSDTNIYLSHIKQFLDLYLHKNNLKILYNNMNGVGVVGLKPLTRDLGIKQFDIVNEAHDAFFQFNHPNPTAEALAGKFTRQVIEGGYDYGMATDSDGDRLGIIDEKGRYISSNMILASLYYYLIKYRKMTGDIVKNCATSIIVDKIANKLGYKCHEVDVGFKNITQGMKDFDALLGGESSGGLTIRGYIYGKDAVFSSALFMEMVWAMNKPVSKIIDEVTEFAEYHHVFKEDSLPLEVDGETILKMLVESKPNFPLNLVKLENYGHNIKFFFENDSWMLIRLSGTEPTLRIFCELESEEEANKCIKELHEFVDSTQKSLLS